MKRMLHYLPDFAANSDSFINGTRLRHIVGIELRCDGRSFAGRGTVYTVRGVWFGVVPRSRDTCRD